MRTVISIAAYTLVVAYPAAVYFGLMRFGARQLVWLLLPLLVLNALLRIPRERRAAWRQALVVPMAAVVPLVLSALFDDHRFMLVTPVLINLILLVGFAGSLRGELPIVERFARLQVSDLSPAEVAHCRRVTVVWSLFFALNASVTAALSAFAPLAWWALYTGVIAYVLIGVVASTEYIVRKLRFGRFGASLLDRVLRGLFVRVGWPTEGQVSG